MIKLLQSNDQYQASEKARFVRTFSYRLCLVTFSSILIAGCDFERRKGGEDAEETDRDEDLPHKVETTTAGIRQNPDQIEITDSLYARPAGFPRDSVAPIPIDSTLFPIRIWNSFSKLGPDSRQSEEKDRLFAELINGFPLFLESVNESLYERSDYEALATAFSESENNNLPHWQRFIDSIGTLGLKVGASEGVIYLKEDPDFIRSFLPELSPTMKVFADQYLYELENPFWVDANILVSVEEHQRRMLFWDRFSREHRDFSLYDDAHRRYEAYLYILMFGSDNTPIFDWEESKPIRTELIEAYRRIVKAHADSQATPLLREYLLLIEENEFRYDRTQYEEFARRNFPNLAY